MRPIFAILAAALAAPAAHAQTPSPEPAAAATIAPMPDPERLAAAERLVALFMPEGSMRRMLASSLPQFGEIPDIAVANLPGMEGEDPNRTVAEVLEERDPHFRERMRITQRVVNETVADLVSEAEPEFRRAMTELYARRFTTVELNEMIGFFSTPTGRKYADVALTMTQDPAFVALMQTVASRMAEGTPQLMERIAAATAHLPSPREERSGSR